VKGRLEIRRVMLRVARVVLWLLIGALLSFGVWQLVVEKTRQIAADNKMEKENCRFHAALSVLENVGQTLSSANTPCHTYEAFKTLERGQWPEKNADCVFPPTSDSSVIGLPFFFPTGCVFYVVTNLPKRLDPSSVPFIWYERPRPYSGDMAVVYWNGRVNPKYDTKQAMLLSAIDEKEFKAQLRELVRQNEGKPLVVATAINAWRKD